MQHSVVMRSLYLLMLCTGLISDGYGWIHHLHHPQRQHHQYRFYYRRQWQPSAGVTRREQCTGRLIAGRCEAQNKSTVQPTSTRRQNIVPSLLEWAQSVANIQISKNLQLQSDAAAGLGWFLKNEKEAIAPGSVILSVPSERALTITAPREGPNDPSVLSLLVRDVAAFRELPWFVQMSLYLFKLKRIDPVLNGVNMKPWLDSLPKQFDTPLHWSSVEELQYDYLQEAVSRQKVEWETYYRALLDATATTTMGTSSSSSVSGIVPTWDEFVWGCECARSRAFSGTYTGDAFNPKIYLFTLLLVTVYVGLNLGTLEQAANGAGVVISVSILKDFVLPKLFRRRQKYVICPLIDMTNHRSVGYTGTVSFEYFANAYSLAVSWDQTATDSTTTGKSTPPTNEFFISYGERTNDQLLQYYGFVETGFSNPYDAYIMPPLGEWNIQALEESCERTFPQGRLEKLDRAGLLGTATPPHGKTESAIDSIANPRGGVVITRKDGIDPAVLQALRALVATDQEWAMTGEAIANFAQPVSPENERLARFVAQRAIEMELSSKATTLEQDEELLNRMTQMKIAERESFLAIQFRIEKKKLLRETIANLQRKIPAPLS